MEDHPYEHASVADQARRDSLLSHRRTVGVGALRLPTTAPTLSSADTFSLCTLLPVLLSVAAIGGPAASQVIPAVDTLDAELLSRSPAIGQPGFILPWGANILVSDWLGNPNLHVLDGETGDLVVSFGRIGAGPGEFANLIVGLQLAHDSGAVWVYDARKLTRIERPGPVGADASLVDLTTSRLRRALWLDATTIVGVNWRNPAERFVFLDEVGTVTRTVPGPLLGHEGIPLEERLHASARFLLCAHPQGSRFAVLFRYATRIEVYDNTAKHLFDTAVPYSIEGPFEHVGGDIVYSPKWIAYPSCWADDDYLYALYSGDRYSRSPGANGDGQEIHVFDWQTGRLSRTFHLDVRVFGFSVAKNAGWLYAGSLADAGIYRFRLPLGVWK